MKYSEQERLEAAQWFLDIHDVEDPSAEMLHDWVRWMEASEAHRLAFAAVERAWWQTPAAALLRPNRADAEEHDDYDGSVSVHDWRQQRARRTESARPDRTLRQTTGAVRRRRVWLGFAAAAAIGAMAVISFPRRQGLFSRPADSGTFATRTGEQMQLTLPDGSQVLLGARSRLSVAYTPAGRDVRLDAGEGFFSVHKDVGRPFRVHVLNGVVTAVGTAFDVRTSNDRVIVAVSEGTVQVSGAGGPVGTTGPSSVPGLGVPAPGAARVTRGESISFVSQPASPTIERATVMQVDPAEPARWRDGWLVYRDEPLRDVLADIGRYTDRAIVVDASVPVTSHFTGAVFKDSVVEWLESLPNAFPVSVTTDGDHITIAPSSSTALAR